MKLFILFHKTALHVAVEKKNVEIIELLLNNPKIKINIKDNQVYFVEIHDFFFVFLWKTPLELTTDQNIKNLFLNSRFYK